MRKAFKYIFAILLGFMPVVFAGLIGALVFFTASKMFGLFLLAGLIPLSLWLGYSIYDRVKVVGIIEFITVNYATPTLNNMKPQVNSITKHFSPADYVLFFDGGGNRFKKGVMKIYGDWFGDPYKEKFEVQELRYDAQKDSLHIRFSEHMYMTISKPTIIQEADSFLKIVEARSVHVEWLENDYKQRLEYDVKAKRIETRSDLNGRTHRFDVSIGEPAVIMYA